MNKPLVLFLMDWMRRHLQILAPIATAWESHSDMTCSGTAAWEDVLAPHTLVSRSNLILTEAMVLVVIHTWVVTMEMATKPLKESIVNGQIVVPANITVTFTRMRLTLAATRLDKHVPTLKAVYLLSTT